ncbi:alpha-L-arabinofuranosidase [Paenibacillus lycopersici]|uniref:Alpha-L-arabinofuranosidase n=1 Tax=Paenibacillus lycopersici TaxID=2704462 RepID=A0A6C0FWT0_9BACL|nr:RICIN domain-containing protein [Paenibacillus lycopersici]QHT59744.1 alpha-L-arabinofuranosidase [Paenibacillus lycopersici]
MKIRIGKKTGITAALIAFVGGNSLFAPSAHASNYTAVVNPGAQYQTFEGWGTSLAWFANRIGGAPDAVRNGYADKLFGSSGLNMNIVRYNIGGGENPAYPNNMELRARVPGFQPTQGTYDWTADANQRWFLQAAKSRIPSSEFIAEAFSNSPPWWMTQSGSVTGNYGAANNLRDDMYDAFADYLVTVNKHFKDYWGVTFRTLEPLNEPNASWWTYGNRQEGAHFDRNKQEIMIQKVADLLTTQGSPTQVSASDETSIDDGRDTINSFSATTKNAIWQYNVHTYGGSDRVGFNTAAAGKNIWMSEHGDGDASGMQMARSIVYDLRYMKNTGWVYWQAVDGGGWGLMDVNDLNDPNSNFTAVTNKKYYALAQWSKFIRPGYKIIDIGDGNSIAAYDTVSKNLVIVTLNDSSSSNTVTYDLSAFSSITGSVTGYQTVTSTGDNLAPITGLTLTNKTFQRTIPAQSTATFVISGANYTPQQPVDTSAYYKLINRNSGKVLDVTGSSTTLGAALVQNTGGSNYSQQWQFVDAGSGYYKLKNRGSGQLADVNNASQNDGMQIIQYSDNGGANQQWAVTDAGGGYVKLFNKNSNKLMDVNGESTADGAAIIQYTDHGGNNQQWQLVKQ